MEGMAVGHNFESDPPRDHPCQVWFNLEKRGDEIFKKSSPRKLLSQYQPNFTEMILGWPPSKTVSVDPDFQPRWNIC
jgi:hypothetical protein